MSYGYSLVLAWGTIFVLRFFTNSGDGVDTFLLWSLRILTIAVVLQVAFYAVQFVRDRVGAAKRGERVFTEQALRTVLLAGLAVGVAFRILTWGPKDQGVVGWVGAVVICLCLLGLALLYLRRARGFNMTPASYWHPYWRAGLLVLFVASLLALGAARPDGVLGGILVGLFWLSLIALVVQVFGTRLHRPQGHR
jgi:hypothetical protein